MYSWLDSRQLTFPVPRAQEDTKRFETAASDRQSKSLRFSAQRCLRSYLARAPRLACFEDVDDTEQPWRRLVCRLRENACTEISCCNELAPLQTASIAEEETVTL